MIKTLIDNKEIMKLQTELFLLRNKAGKDFNHRVTARFGKRGAGKILKDGVREKHTVKAGKVFDKVNAKPTGRHFNGGVIVNARSRQKGIEHFKVSPRRTTPSRRIGVLRAETQKGSRVSLRKVFTGNMPGPNHNVFYQRIPGAINPRTNKEKLKRIAGPSLFVMYKRNEEAINEQYESGFVKEAINSIEAVKRRLVKK